MLRAARRQVVEMGRRAGSVQAYGVAVLASLCALGVALLLPQDADAAAPVLFLGAVAVTGWYGGLGPALLATVLGVLALDYFFESPPNSLLVSDTRTLVASLAYLLVALLLGSLNAQLRTARDRAEAALRARDEALAAVSHDMRTPLTAIQASAAALVEAEGDADANGGMSAELRTALLRNIADESQRLEHFIGNALALGRIEAGMASMPTMNAPGEVVSAILDRRMPLLAGRPIEFDVPDWLPLLRFDVSLLEQALGNLLDNAALHTPAGTPVAVRGRMDDAGWLRLEVDDAGPGIPVEVRERIFDKFQRLQCATPGAGLGLSLARAAAQAQGGQVLVEASPLGGARFVLRIPGAALHQVPVRARG